ncbi:MAG: hypothetical protein EPN50_05655, partial [Chloroflexota bacterium]
MESHLRWQPRPLPTTATVRRLGAPLADEEAAGLGRRAEIDAILAAPTRLRPLVQPVLALAGG